MSKKKDKNIEALAKIISLTRDDKLKWKSVNSKIVQGQYLSDIISSVFVTQYQEKILRIYQRKYESSSRDISRGAISVGAMLSASFEPKLRWHQEIILELINNEGNSLWIFPREAILNDLLVAVQYKVSGADDLINSLLEE